MYLISFCDTVINQSDARKREIFIEENSNFFFIDLSEKSCKTMINYRMQQILQKKEFFFVIKICHVQCEREKKMFLSYDL